MFIHKINMVDIGALGIKENGSNILFLSLHGQNCVTIKRLLFKVDSKIKGNMRCNDILSIGISTAIIGVTNLERHLYESCEQNEIHILLYRTNY